MSDQEPTIETADAEPPRDPAFSFNWRGTEYEWRGSAFRPAFGHEGHSVCARGRLWTAKLQLQGRSYAADGTTPPEALEAALGLFVIETNNLLHCIAPGAFVIDGKERREFRGVETRL